MFMEGEETNTADAINSLTAGFLKWSTALLVLTIITYWTVNSFRNRGGILHGARWMLSLYNLKAWFGFGPKNLKFPYDDQCRLGREEPFEAVRTVSGSRGTIVYGWPSTSGLWFYRQCYGIVRKFLGLSRFEPSTTEKDREPDEFCKRLEMIGARSYESKSAFSDPSIRAHYRRIPRIWYGWPGWPGWPGSPEIGGVWVLRTQDFEGAEMGIARMRNALNMQERCKAIEMLGGKFYPRWVDVPEYDRDVKLDM